MDKLRKLLTEAKSTDEQIRIIADAVCEDVDLDIDTLISEDFTDVVTAAIGSIKGITRAILGPKPDQAAVLLSKETGIPVEKIMAMNPEDKRNLLLKSMAKIVNDQYDDMRRGFEGFKQ
jgi:hypothetical protein